MDVTKEQILHRLTVLKIKVEERLKLCRGDRVTPHVFSVFRKDILQYIFEMETCITKLELGSFPETDLLETEAEWAPRLMEYHRELGDLDGSFSPSSCLDPVSQSFGVPSTPGRSSASFVVKPPQIQITGPTFSGLEMADDHMSFRNFLTRFENCVVGMANDSERLNFLKCSLSDRALRLINHLSCTDANYQRALSVLKREYLDIDEIIDQIFQDILDYVPKKDICCSGLGEFISRTASLLEELGNSFSCDFSVDDSGGARLMAKILFRNFPKKLKGEMIGLTGKRIPSLSAILELTSEAVKRLRVKGSASAASTFTTGQGSSQKTARRATVTSSFHVDSNNLTSAGYSRSLPPILLVTFFNGEKMVSVNCLLDTGSGRSYLSADVLRDLGSVETVESVVGLDFSPSLAWFPLELWTPFCQETRSLVKWPTSPLIL
ncbi:adk [Acanthosepion pharaonis]|uniref:Adk n=1 Tax=Acanthosepion pharaonis TaxID=158019 RepID=A0A812C3D1_ACAPH|nr:adk [Sepia pharaonis]